MKTNRKNIIINGLIVLSVILFFASCKKENSIQGTTTNAAAVASLQAVSVGISNTTPIDSIYVIGTCSRDHHLDSISAGSLPAAVTTYLSTNYAGYTFQKAYTDNDSSGYNTGYVVIIQYNGNPIGLKFDAFGNFVRILEQREGRDLTGNGWHDGGRFGDRDGRHRDTIAISTLLAAISSYFSTNYPSDTLVRAYQTIDSRYVVFSIDNGAFATTFSATGSLISRVQLENQRENVAAVDQSGLPATIQSYFSTTYPAYVFNQAFSVSKNGTLLGYVVCIDSNGTKYAVKFDASGTFLKAITIR